MYAIGPFERAQRIRRFFYTSNRYVIFQVFGWDFQLIVYIFLSKTRVIGTESSVYRWENVNECQKHIAPY